MPNDNGYTVVSGKTMEELIKAVLWKQYKDWFPFGGIAVWDGIFYQAMKK